MSEFEYLPCHFGLRLDGGGDHPSHLNVDISSGAESLAQKGIARVFLTFKKSVTVTEAEELDAAMNRCLAGLCVVHLER